MGRIASLLMSQLRESNPFVLMVQLLTTVCLSSLLKTEYIIPLSYMGLNLHLSYLHALYSRGLYLMTRDESRIQEFI